MQLTSCLNNLGLAILLLLVIINLSTAPLPPSAALSLDTTNTLPLGLGIHTLLGTGQRLENLLNLLVDATSTVVAHIF